MNSDVIAALDAINGALNEISCVLSYNASIPQDHKEDIWRKMQVVEDSLETLKRRQLLD